MRAPEFRPIAKEDYAQEAPWFEKIARPLNAVLSQIRSGLDRGLTLTENLNAEIKTVEVRGGRAAVPATPDTAATDTHVYATVDVESGSGGAVSIVGDGHGVASVSKPVVAGASSARCLRFTFSSAMADTNYAALATWEGTQNVAAIMHTVEKETGYFTVTGYVAGTGWQSIDASARRVTGLAYRYTAGSAGSAGTAAISPFPVRVTTSIRGKAAGVLILKAVSFDGRNESAVTGIGGLGWEQDGSTIKITGVTGLVEGTNYRLTLAILGA